ncbi:Uncharacterized protein HZ326_16886 [Fusarium oxysporum f. sp. albedinis]|nr:Uncharacterized protein HZ326_16886 [Fusarium oxysporum f. sp. albedinis]
MFPATPAVFHTQPITSILFSVCKITLFPASTGDGLYHVCPWATWFKTHRRKRSSVVSLWRVDHHVPDRD